MKFLPRVQKTVLALLFSTAIIVQSTYQVHAFAIPVFDAGNFGQNIVEAAKTLQQINNQITQLQNDAQMLINQAKNLMKMPGSIAANLQSSLHQLDNLIRNANGVAYKISEIDQKFQNLYPDEYSTATSNNQIFQDAKAIWQQAKQGFQHSMHVQANVVEQVRNDRSILNGLISDSQSATGNLQVMQAGNQIQALAAKQNMQLQSLLAASARAEALNQAAALQTKEQARARFQNFLGDGSAYSH